MEQMHSGVSGIIWKTMERYCVLGIQFVLQIVLARIIDPDAYGVIAIAGIFIGLSSVFVQKGFALSIVQRKETSQDDVSSVFFISLFIAAFFYALIFLISPWVADFFEMPQLKSLLRVMAVCIFPGAYSSIQNALLSRQINFKAVFFASTTSVSVSGGIAIILALKGAGVWALVFQHVTNSFVVVTMQYIQLRWKPKLVLNLHSVSKYWKFGWKVLLQGLIDELFVEMRTFVIGKAYTTTDLSFYNRGRHFPHLLMNSINGSLSSVLLPVFSKIQDNKEAMSSLLRTAIRSSCFILFPLLTIIACCAHNLVLVLLTEKWLPCVVYIQLFCIYFATWAITTPEARAILALGRSGLVLKLEIVRKIFDILSIIIALRLGVFAIALSAVAVQLISVLLYVSPTKRHIGYSFRQTISDLTPIMLLSIVVGGIVIGLGMIVNNSIICLILQVCIGIIVYIILARLFRLSSYSYLVSKIPEKLFIKKYL